MVMLTDGAPHSASMLELNKQAEETLATVGIASEIYAHGIYPFLKARATNKILRKISKTLNPSPWGERFWKDRAQENPDWVGPVEKAIADIFVFLDQNKTFHRYPGLLSDVLERSGLLSLALGRGEKTTTLLTRNVLVPGLLYLPEEPLPDLIAREALLPRMMKVSKGDAIHVIERMLERDPKAAWAQVREHGIFDQMATLPASVMDHPSLQLHAAWNLAWQGLDQPTIRADVYEDLRTSGLIGKVVALDTLDSQETQAHMVEYFTDLLNKAEPGIDPNMILRDVSESTLLYRVMTRPKSMGAGIQFGIAALTRCDRALAEKIVDRHNLLELAHKYGGTSDYARLLAARGPGKSGYDARRGAILVTPDDDQFALVMPEPACSKRPEPMLVRMSDGVRENPLSQAFKVEADHPQAPVPGSTVPLRWVYNNLAGQLEKLQDQERDVRAAMGLLNQAKRRLTPRVAPAAQAPASASGAENPESFKVEVG